MPARAEFRGEQPVAAARRRWPGMKFQGLLGSPGGRRMGHKQHALINRRLAHQRIAQPLLPNHTSPSLLHLHQRAALGVEGHHFVGYHRRGRSVVACLDLPNDSSRLGVQGVKLVRAVAAADKEHPIGVGRRGDGPPAGEPQHPAALTVGGAEGSGFEIAACRWEIHFHGLTQIDSQRARLERPVGSLVWGCRSGLYLGPRIRHKQCRNTQKQANAGRKRRTWGRHGNLQRRNALIISSRAWR